MVSRFPPHIGGTEMHTYILSKTLVKEGHDVFLIVPAYDKGVKEIDGVSIVEVETSNVPFWKKLGYIINAKKILENIVKKENIDIIHGHLICNGGLIAVEIGNKYNIPTYVTVHVSGFLNNSRNLLEKILVKKTLDKADHVLAVSNDIIDEISNSNIKNIKEKISFHFNAIDIEKFKEISKRHKRTKPVVLCVSRLDKRKNINLLLDAKKHTKTDFDLIIVGDGKERSNLEKKVEDENIKNVNFMGLRSDVEKILPHADLFVLPSVNEPFGIVYIEALACGLPVIGCNDGGVKEIINTDVGLLVKPNDTKSLINAIDKILTDKKLYNKCKSNVRMRAMEFCEMKIPYAEL